MIDMRIIVSQKRNTDARAGKRIKNRFTCARAFATGGEPGCYPLGWSKEPKRIEIHGRHAWMLTNTPAADSNAAGGW